MAHQGGVLAACVRGRVQSAGFPRLGCAVETTIWRILAAANIRPHRSRYYLEKGPGL